jgi:aldose 1-epimerase
VSTAPLLDATSVRREPFGALRDGTRVERYTLHAGGGLTARVLTYGAILQELVAPDRHGRPASVVLGLPLLEDYAERNTPYLGAIVGRYANRIAGAEFTLDGIRHRLPANDGANCLHGGRRGFDKHVWRVAGTPRSRTTAGLVLRHASLDGDEGFPGAVVVDVAYTLARDDSLRIDLRATTDRATVLNPTSHVYWQLAGEGSGSVEGHVLTVAASRYLPVDRRMIPTGELAPVAGTPFDFTAPATVGARLREAVPQFASAHGYDHHFVLDAPGLHLTAVRLDEPGSGRRLEIETTEPGVQVYSGNHLDGSLAGPSGRSYRQGDGLALETQHCPDSPNRPEFPSTVLRPGAIFASTTVHRLSIVEERDS